MLGGVEKIEALEWVLGKLSAAPAVKAPAFPKLVSLQEKQRELTVKRQNELELWQTWKGSNHDPIHLDPLLKSLNPLIESQSGKYKNRVEIPNAAIDFEHKQRVVDALKTYDPEKGKLSSWVGNYLKKGNRFILTHQNLARIPENIAQHIGVFNAARADLKDRLGHEPDAMTLAEETGLALKDVKRLAKEQRRALIASGASDDLSPAANFSSREHEVIQLIYHQLSPQERVVHEFTFGLNGRPLMKPGQIAKATGMDGSKVAKLRTAIFNKMKPHLESSYG